MSCLASAEVHNRQSQEIRQPAQQSSACHLFLLQSTLALYPPLEQSSGSLRPFCQSHYPSNQPRELVFSMSVPRTGAPNTWLKPPPPQGISPPMHFPFSIEFPPIGTDPDLVTSLPSRFPIDLSYNFGCLSLSANLQLVFSYNFPTYKAVFDVFMGRSELHTLLLNKFDLLLYS